MSSLLTGIATGVRISPYYVLMASGGAAFAAKDVYEDRALSLCGVAGVAQIGLALASMRINLIKYRLIVHLMQGRGYRYFALDPHLKSFCGRRVLSAAAKDNHLHHLYKRHLRARRIRWHQFDQNPLLRVVYPTGVALYATGAIGYAFHKPY